MVKFNHTYEAESKSVATDYIFYCTTILLAAAVFSYLVFNFKVQLQSMNIQEIEKKYLALGTGERQIFNKKVINYKKKIDDFTVILNNHKITSNIFGFVEENTLPGVWFSNFNMQETTSEVRLSGEAKNMEELSRQIKILEESKDYVKSINILDSKTNSSGSVNFVLNMVLNPKIFAYQESLLPESLGTNENNP